MEVINREAYSAGHASKAASIAYHQLNHWAMLGVVVPSIDCGAGYGGVREYSLADVVALKVVAGMKESGFALSKLRTLVERIQQWDEQSTKTFFVGTDDGSVEAFDEHDAIAVLRSKDRKGLTWFVNIAETAEELKTRLTSMSRPRRGKAIRVS